MAKRNRKSLRRSRRKNNKSRKKQVVGGENRKKDLQMLMVVSMVEVKTDAPKKSFGSRMMSAFQTKPLIVRYVPNDGNVEVPDGSLLVGFGYGYTPDKSPGVYDFQIRSIQRFNNQKGINVLEKIVEIENPYALLAFFNETVPVSSITLDNKTVYDYEKLRNAIDAK